MGPRWSFSCVPFSSSRIQSSVRSLTLTPCAHKWLCIMSTFMKLRALLLIVVLALMSGVICAIVCPEDTSDSHGIECTQCIPTDVVVSAKISGDQALDTYALCCTAAIDISSLSKSRDTLDQSRTLASPPSHRAATLALRV